MEFKHHNTDGRNVWTTKGIMLKNKSNLVTFHETILVSQRTFLLTLIYIQLWLKLLYMLVFFSLCRMHFKMQQCFPVKKKYLQVLGR